MYGDRLRLPEDPRLGDVGGLGEPGVEVFAAQPVAIALEREERRHDVELELASVVFACERTSPTSRPTRVTSARDGHYLR
jgi:hypothetical protein